VGLPRLLSDIITEMIKAQPDMELVPSKAPLDMRSHLLKSEADAVMAGLVNDELPPGCEDLCGRARVQRSWESRNVAAERCCTSFGRWSQS